MRLVCLLMAFILPISVEAQSVLPAARYAAGVKQVEFVDPADGRMLDFMLIYPVAADTNTPLFKVMLSANLHLHKDAPLAADRVKHPLIMFSHGAGGNGSGYAWFGEYLASRGYVVALLYHYRANSFDTSALYVRNRLGSVRTTSAWISPIS